MTQDSSVGQNEISVRRNIRCRRGVSFFAVYNRYPTTQNHIIGTIFVDRVVFIKIFDKFFTEFVCIDFPDQAFKIYRDRLKFGRNFVVDVNADARNRFFDVIALENVFNKNSADFFFRSQTRRLPILFEL